MSIKEFGFKYLENLQFVTDRINMNQIQAALDLIVKTRDSGGTVWLIGNGGLASLAEHMAVDFQLAGVKAIALTQSAAITTYANDFKFEDVFMKQLQTFAKHGDLVIAMSGSGNSQNVRYLDFLEPFGVSSIGIGGADGAMKKDCTLYISLPTSHIGQAQDAAQVVLHILTYYLLMENRIETKRS